MRKSILAVLCLSTVACVTTNASERTVQAALTGMIAAETAASIRCPQSSTERAVFLVGRTVFDLNFAARLSPAQADALAAVRRTADRTCGFTAAEAAAAAEEIH